MSELSQNPEAIKTRLRREKDREKEKAAAEAEDRRIQDNRVAHRAHLVRYYGEDRTRAWECLHVAGALVYDLMQFFFPSLIEGDCDVTDENVEETIDLLARALEGIEGQQSPPEVVVKAEPKMPPTNWDRFRDDVAWVRRLGRDMDVTRENCREFFGYWLGVKRGEIVVDPCKPYPWVVRAKATSEVPDVKA